MTTSSTKAKAKRISTRSGKAKGRNLQNKVRDAVLNSFPELTEDDVKGCPMGSNGEDIQLSREAKKQFPYSVECKARAKVGLIYDAMEQATRNAKGLTPVAVVKADRKQPLVVLSLEDFMRLVSSNDNDGETNDE